MSVLIEGISVVVKNTTLEAKYPGGVSAYEAASPNRTYCSDAFLSRVGFMSPDDVKHLIDGLLKFGFEFIQHGQARDVAVVDQRQGVTVDCSWLQFARHPKGHAFAWLADKEPGDLAVPQGWEFQRSLSNSYSFVPTEEVKQRIQFIRTDKGVDIFRDELTDREIFLGCPDWSR